MPHSPRWHAGKLWVLNSGAGELQVVDPKTGQRDTVARLPGYARAAWPFTPPCVRRTVENPRESGIRGHAYRGQRQGAAVRDLGRRAAAAVRRSNSWPSRPAARKSSRSKCCPESDGRRSSVSSRKPSTASLSYRRHETARRKARRWPQPIRIQDPIVGASPGSGRDPGGRRTKTTTIAQRRGTISQENRLLPR
jgi:hypothetical protein